MSEDWSDWYQHDGRGCPVSVGQYVQIHLSYSGVKEGPVTKEVVECVGWIFSACPTDYVTRYRIRRPRAFEHLRQIARDVEHLTPQAGSREIAQFTRERMK